MRLGLMMRHFGQGAPEGLKVIGLRALSCWACSRLILGMTDTSKGTSDALGSPMYARSFDSSVAREKTDSVNDVRMKPSDWNESRPTFFDVHFL
jgi:hypothetical protein